MTKRKDETLIIQLSFSSFFLHKERVKMRYHLEETEDVLKDRESTVEGLTGSDIALRTEKYGENRLAEPPKESIIHKFIKQICEPMTIVLIIAAIISAVTAVISHEGFADVIIIMTVVILNAVLGVYQESKAESAIEALQQMSAARSRVLRDGKEQVVNSSELVPGDIIMLEAGDAVPADARLIEAASLKCEEAALTGESVPSEKSTEKLFAPEGQDVPLGDRKNMIYMGSSVQYGRAKAVVVETGMTTEMGKIADQLSKAEKEETPLQIKLSELSKILSIMVLIICAVIFAINIIRNLVTGEGLSGQFFLDTFMVAISLAVAAIPEGLAAVVTVLLSIGVTKMSKNRAIIRKLTAVETLGCTEIICSDKTGTLTQNKMTVVKRVTNSGMNAPSYDGTQLSYIDEMLVKGMALCSDAEWDGEKAVGEATECALVTDAAKQGFEKASLKKEYPRVGEAPFDSLRKMMTTVHKLSDGSYIQFTKGAPDCVLENCTSYLEGADSVKPMTSDNLKSIRHSNKNMADQALRVLCLAYKKYDSEPSDYKPEVVEKDLIYVGLCGMIDPIRPEVKIAIEKCRAAGIRPIMITGDHKDTAVAIAKELGILSDDLKTEEKAITGSELEQMDDDYFNEHIREFSVYARVQPEHKVKIVNGWKKLGKVTAMTGDGVNDAPSIKSADIGVGMGITGTDVTKNVADMILTDDNFATIVEAVAEGRRIYDNIRKAIQFLLSSNLSEVIAIFIATLMNITLLKPAHLLWINLITDSLPAIGLGMEEAEPDIMNVPPRKKTDGIFADGLGFDIVFQGLIIALLTVFSYIMGNYMSLGRFEIVTSDDGMTMAFLTLSLIEIFHSFNMRSRNGSIFKIKKQNLLLWGSFALAFVLTTSVIYIPFFRKIFSFAEISLKEYGVAILIAIMIIPIVEIEKLIKRHIKKK